MLVLAAFQSAQTLYTRDGMVSLIIKIFQFNCSMCMAPKTFPLPKPGNDFIRPVDNSELQGIQFTLLSKQGYQSEVAGHEPRPSEANL